MANKVEIIVVAKDMTKATFDDIERKAKDAGTKAGEDAGKALNDSLEKNVGGDGVADKIGEDLGDDIKGGIEKSLSDSDGIGKSVGDKVGDGIKDGAEKGLQETEKLFEDNGKQSGDKFSTGFSGAIISGIEKAGTGIVGALSAVFQSASSGTLTTGLWAGVIAGAVAAAPLIVGAIAGAIAGAAVITAAVAGVILAGMADPSIGTEAKALGTEIMDALKIDAAPFIQPVHDAILTLGDDFRQLEPTIQNIFANASQYVSPLTDAFAGFIANVTQGIDALVEKAGPDFMAGFTAGLDDVGTSLQTFLEAIGDNGPAAAEAFEGALELVSGALGLLTDAVNVLLPVWETFVEAIRSFQPTAEGEWVEYTSELNGVSNGLSGVAGAAQLAAQNMNDLMSAQLAMLDPALQYSNALVDVAKKQDLYTAAVQKYGAGSVQANNAALELANSTLKAGDAATQTGSSLANGLTPAMRATMEAMGISKPAIDAADQALKNVASSAKAVPGKVQVNLTQEGAEGAISKFDQVKSAVNAIPSNKTVTINVVETGAGVAALKYASGGNVGKAATGGVRSNMVLVGEQGPELVSLPYGSTVKTTGQTRAMLRKSESLPMGGGSMDYAEMLSELREIRKALAQGGNIYLDNRLLGSIQGREADLYDRAG